MLFSLQDLEAAFNATVLEDARFLLDAGFVEKPDVRRDGALITSFVRPGSGGSYGVYVRTGTGKRGQASVRGECSCPRRQNCEHVAAVLLRSLADEQLPAAAAVSARKPDAGGQAHRVDGSGSLTLLYLIYPRADVHSGVEVATVTAVSLRSGGYDRFRSYHPAWVSRSQPPRFLAACDLELISELDSLPARQDSGHRSLQGRRGEHLLARMLETERCLLGEGKRPLRLSGERPARLCWEVDGQGCQHPEFQVDPAAPFVFMLDFLFYLDPSSGDCGHLETQLPEALVRELLKMPDVAPENAQAVHETLSNRYPGAEIPVLQRLELKNLCSERPMPCLELVTMEPDSRMGMVDLALLSFDYDGVRVSDPRRCRYLRDNTVLNVQRNEAFERSCAALLTDAGLVPTARWQLAEAAEIFVFDGETKVCFDFQIGVVPGLRELGWRVEQGEGFRNGLAEIQRWYGEVEPTAEGEWFDVSVGVEVDGERINLLPVLVELLEEYPQLFRHDRLQELDPDQQLVVPLANGRLMPLPLERVSHILQTLFELYQPGVLDDSERLRFGAIQLARLAELSDVDKRSPLKWLGGDALQTLVQRLRSVEGIPDVKTPAGFGASLRGYQQKGLAWLQFLRENEFGGVLADDMGLGKTVQSLAHLLLEKEQGRMDVPSLVVAPTSLMANWRREAGEFSPALEVLTLHGGRRHRLFDRIPEHDLVLTTYPLLGRDDEALLEHRFHLLILDEAQIIKNPKTRASRVVRQLRARHRLCLTGTPLENHLGELWSLFDFLMPGLLGSDKQFRRIIRHPIEKQQDESAAQRLSRRLRPFMLRRTKAQVVQELPPKTEIIRTVELEGGQRDLYESIRLAMHERVQRAVVEKGWDRSRIVVLDALLKLRQVCCDPRLLKLESARKVDGSAKLDLLMGMLPELIEEGRTILLFSQFTSMLALIQQAIENVGIDYVKLTGQTRDRASPVERFQQGQVPVFLISLKAGGLGLNLTAADTVIHYDPWWNPAAERQATDRAHRIGQVQPVFVYKLISEGTVEEKILALQARKQALADSLFDQQGGAGAVWSPIDLDALFEPMG